MKIASVVGATGYVGSAIVKCLCDKGFLVRCSSRVPARAEWLKALGNIEIWPITLGTGPEVSTELVESLKPFVRGAECVFFCAGFEKQEQATIDFMTSNSLALIEAAKQEKVKAVVLTSSGGSTNPPGLDDSTPKNEVLHWSDPQAQIAAGKFSPASKTLMEIGALSAVGRNQQNEVVDSELAGKSPRLVIMNPNLILGPQLQPGEVNGNSLPWIAQILKGERMNQFVPNDSMSVIDVRDLAALHVAAATNPTASGRYFGVNRSFPWYEILGTFADVYPPYSPPPRKEGEDYEGKVPTQFDHSRKESLGVPLRSLKETLGDLVAFLKERSVIP